MAPVQSTLTSPSTYHILTYGLLLGSQFYQSFLAGPIAYRALPRPQFAQLQTKTFPIYFLLQTLLPAALYLTCPTTLPSTFTTHHPLTSNSTPTSLLSSCLTSSLITAATGLINLLVVGPVTTKVMKERKAQETKDGRRYDDVVKSEEMKRLNGRFGMWHGVSSLLNLVGLGAGVWYAGELGRRLI